MPATLTYAPNKGVFIGDRLLLWGSDREQVRTLLDDKFQIDDNVIDLGDSSRNIIQRRDTYKDYQGKKNLFFLNFDENDKLNEVEVHYGLNINIAGIAVKTYHVWLTMKPAANSGCPIYRLTTLTLASITKPKKCGRH